MSSKERISWIPIVISIFFVGISAFVVLPKKSEAVPQFARRYNLKCSACHTIVPVLNEQGYLFKRLGYHLPPALEKGQPGPKISDLVKKEPDWLTEWRLKAYRHWVKLQKTEGGPGWAEVGSPPDDLQDIYH